jgi:hypothetical protein
MKPAFSKAFNRPPLGVETARGRVVPARELPKTGGLHPLNDALPLRADQEPPLDRARGVLPLVEYLGLYRGTTSISMDANSEHPAKIEATTEAMPFRHIGFEKSGSAR